MNDHTPNRLRDVIDRLRAVNDTCHGHVTIHQADLDVALRLIDKYAARWLDEASGHLSTSADLETTRHRLDQLADAYDTALRTGDALVDRLHKLGDRDGLAAILADAIDPPEAPAC